MSMTMAWPWPGGMGVLNINGEAEGRIANHTHVMCSNSINLSIVHQFKV